MGCQCRLVLEMLEDRLVPSTLSQLYDPTGLAVSAGVSPPQVRQPSPTVTELVQQGQRDDPTGFALLSNSPQALVIALTATAPPNSGVTFPPDSSPLDHFTAPTDSIATALIRLPTPQPAKGIAVFDSATAVWYFRNTISPGAPTTPPFAYGAPGTIPIEGDWDGDGRDSIGVFDPATATFYLRNSNSPGAPDAGTFHFGWVDGIPRPYLKDGKTLLGVVNKATGEYAQAVPGGVQTSVVAVPLPTQTAILPDGAVDLVLNEWLMTRQDGVQIRFRYGALGWVPFEGAF